MPELRKLLVANRGEIASRVLRTARAMGYETVAVYSDADRDAPHVRLADEAVSLGAAAVAESYLNAARILEAARWAGADAVHPGYGFLSENAAFAEACEQAGLVFVGPPAEAMRTMADKARAKACMQAAGVPVVPGFWAHADDQRLREEAARVGFPLLVKATAGGGGRGIRVLHDASALPEALASARREATSAFGDGNLMIERYVERARHVEVQVFADAHGNVVHLGERDCSAQRRRQKIIEEAPCANIPPALRQALGEQAVRAACAVGYRGAGTVEFIVDTQDRFYFLEMNTRLQVEHPVTELITGLDLVRLQLMVAAGEPLPFAQSEVTFRGHAIEARLYAEDPAQSFAPQTGRVLRFDTARALEQPGVRIDAGCEEGSVVTPHYDALLAKVIAYGETRAEARRRLLRALSDAALFGVRTNAAFLHALLRSDAFVRAAFHTALIDGWLTEAPQADATQAPSAQKRPPRSPTFSASTARPAPSEELWAVAACVLAEGLGAEGLRPRGIDSVALTLVCDDRTRAVRVSRRDRIMEAQLDTGSLTLCLLAHDDGSLSYVVGPLRRRALYLRTHDALHLSQHGAVYVFREPSSVSGGEAERDPRRVLAPLAGVVGRVEVAVGDQVHAGDVLMVIEAMKMEIRVPCTVDARVSKIHHGPGKQVEANTLLMELDTPTEVG